MSPKSQPMHPKLFIKPVSTQAERYKHLKQRTKQFRKPRFQQQELWPSGKFATGKQQVSVQHEQVVPATTA